jgi:hypothetical protein
VEVLTNLKAVEPRLTFKLLELQKVLTDIIKDPRVLKAMQP